MTATVHDPTRTSGRRRSLLALGGLALGLGLIALAFVNCGGSPYVSEIVVANPTGYPLSVEVTGQADSAWLLLGTAQPGRDHRFQEVLDQGEVWVFRFGYGGRMAGELTVPRSELEESGWRVEVPLTVESTLLEEGAPPPPRP